MGNPKSFLEYERKVNPSTDPLMRIQNFEEFHPNLQVRERTKQAGRCMNCGVPFCQSGAQFGGMYSGCPLHNLIPEWNDEIYNNKIDEQIPTIDISNIDKKDKFPNETIIEPIITKNKFLKSRE